MEAKILIFMMNLLIIIGGLNIAVLLLERVFVYWNKFVWEKHRFAQWLNLFGLSEENKAKLENYDGLYKLAETICEQIPHRHQRSEMNSKLRNYIVEAEEE